ncbi:MAG: MBL fold metallo-hydrolase [Planctomycetota bacterium]|jgi:glyoxylase-like metal-dependent hydrolase (beta-lactamase superfamily II)
MPVITLAVGPLQANCHVAWTEGGTRALVIDAGGDADAIAEELAARSLEPEVLFSTHGHVDHVAANSDLKERFPKMKLAIMRDERDTLMRPTLNLSFFVGGALEPPEPDELLDDGDTLEVGGMSFRVIHVPGHTVGGGVLFGEVDGGPVAFTGDTLFAGGIGRSDFPGGDPAALVAAIRERILTLPDDTIVYSGHGPETTVERERASNPFVGG